VFGLERGAQLDRLRELLTEVLSFAESPLSILPFAQPLLAGRGSMGRLERAGEEADRLIYALIEERRADVEADSPDVLALLLAARHEDDSPMSDQELRDELMTALVAGHETTASQLAWGFEQLARVPRVLGRLTEVLDRDPDDEAYLTATIQELMRRRPVLMNAEPRLVKQEIRIGDSSYPPGVVLIASAFLVHHDPDVYESPNELRPERFLESAGGKPPGTYTWLPFGGGRRRCLGASFAMLEMKVVLRAVVERFALEPVGEQAETATRRSITISPSRGCEVVLHRRGDASPSRLASGGRVPLAVV
jgi:cytochrome P450